MLVELYMDARVSVRTLRTVEVWEIEGLTGFDNEGGGESPVTFNPERGTGQGDISSPHTWVTVFELLLLLLLILLLLDSSHIMAAESITSHSS